ncbi:type II toxin-antitoxin system RelE/ParE family toxin [Carboxylicivirga sp. N1Y90]|uniref:type II toxin-antitoxin system RelE/ParE family toxin n=1 Tax=Carboxylicivirga fragile TaxID=3417571 RepID=UPI003D340A3A|nr:type II toxin-antitoxin system RelE/ParE family toxin [Marinilabiliaceae bacterium N1Y90]
MKQKFEIIFLDEAIKFVNNLDKKSRNKVLYNIDKAKYVNDPKLLKKLEGEIWYFRTKFMTLQYRLFAFWDKSDNIDTLVIATHGVVKKSNKVAKAEIDKAERTRQEYYTNKTR